MGRTTIFASFARVPDSAVRAPELRQGHVVATVMGGMGRRFDGGYAEFTCPPASQVRRVDAALPWETLGKLPVILQTAWAR